MSVWTHTYTHSKVAGVIINKNKITHFFLPLNYLFGFISILLLVSFRLDP